MSDIKRHEYVGRIDFCMSCFKKPDDPIHIIVKTCSVDEQRTNLQSQISPQAINEDKPKIPFHTHTCESCNKVTKDNNIDCVLQAMIICDDCKALGSTALNAVMLKSENLDKCPGHSCPSCSAVWMHSYNCKKPASRGLCEKCATQDAAEINRPQHIEAIKLGDSKSLTGKEYGELKIQTEEFIVLNLIHDSSGSVRSDWQEKLSEFIKAKERIIEEIRVQLSVAHRKRAEQECEDLTKLTDEEREQYKRDAAKLKKTKEPKQAKPAEGSVKEKKIASLLKLLGGDTPENRKKIEALMGI